MMSNVLEVGNAVWAKNDIYDYKGNRVFSKDKSYIIHYVLEDTQEVVIIDDHSKLQGFEDDALDLNFTTSPK